MKNSEKTAKRYLRKSLIALLCLVIFLNYLLIISTVRIKGDNSELENNKTMPPTLTLITVALGPIRGLIADALWWHVAELQERTEYFEILKYTDWITTLQPKNPFVWTYHAWNLAYNIAYEFPTAKSRWEWIYSSIKLLRDEGLQLNPDDNFIKNELAWIFVDRVGGTSDPQYDYYIEKWSELMGKYMKTGDRKEIMSMVANPDSTSEFEKTSQLKAFILEAEQKGIDILDKKNQQNPLTEKQIEYLNRDKSALAQVDLFNRTNAIRKEMKLDPKRMLYIDKNFGPFNWLLPPATAIYWGARDKKSQYSQGYLNYKEVVPVAMQQSFLKGSIVANFESGIFTTTNNFAVAPNVIKVYRERIKDSDKPDLEKGNCLMFLINAIPILYSFNEIETASLLFDEYKKLQPENTMDLRSFTINQFLRLEHQGAARYQQSLVEITLYSAYKALSDGKKEKAANFAATAKTVWEKHQQKYGHTILKIPPFESIKSAAFCKAFFFMKNSHQRKNIIKLAENEKSGNLYLKNAASLTYNGKNISNYENYRKQ